MLLAKIRPCLHFVQSACHRLLSSLLQTCINGGVDLQPTRIYLFGRDDLLEFMKDSIDGPTVERVDEGLLAGSNLLRQCLLMLGFRDKWRVMLLHLLKNDIPLLE